MPLYLTLRSRVSGSPGGFPITHKDVEKDWRTLVLRAHMLFNWMIGKLWSHPVLTRRTSGMAPTAPSSHARIHLPCNFTSIGPVSSINDLSLITADCKVSFLRITGGSMLSLPVLCRTPVLAALASHVVLCPFAMAVPSSVINRIHRRSLRLLEKNFLLCFETPP
jgi:hypothetical protein